MKAVFIDRDGVVNKTYFRDGKSRAPSSLAEFEFLPGVSEAILNLRNAGYLLVIVTNQPDVARGLQTRDIVETMNAFVVQQLNVHDLKVCYHDDPDACLCRKPQPGMLLEAAQAWSIDLTRSFMVGDRFTDIEAGKAAGCTTILIGAGEGEKRLNPDHAVESLLEASRLILGFI